ncbi:MAG: acyl-CoA/acyl-ACP dehydrogenase [Candidatus Sphingomonas colombiensis]|nr:acyl-CoA dehydrogenase family protein [Sphingomonas sp.]WEK42398.1 MAG: acyl-CoA/acyl-ACP dehydrogenase [Sphingomonas sp.]
MNFDLSDEQKMLAEQARGLLGERSTPDRLRALIDSGAEWDEPLWREIAEMGFLGATIPESFGGLGLTELDLGVISEEMGRANVALPFFSSIVLAADAIRLAGSEEQKAVWLPKLASGEAIGTFAYAEGAAGWAGPALKATFEGGALNATKTPVADGGIATVAVVLAQTGGKPALVLVDLAQPGVIRTKLDSFDQLRPHYTLTFTNASAELLAGQAIEELFDRAAVQAAFEAVGGTDACLTMARDYAMERAMFGRPLASYQAIKHKLADIAVALELARSNAYFGGWAAGESTGDLPSAAAAARLTAISAFERAARENLQVHGGIGYTWEANCHFYYRRERTLAVSLGNREAWADRLMSHLPAEQAKGA